MKSDNPESGITVADLRTHTVTGVVQHLIERMILSGELKPGQRLNETALATQLAVSRGPVREACRSLVELGLLCLIPNRGIFVRRFTKQDVAEVFELRAGLVALSALLLLPVLRADVSAGLDRLLDEMEDAAQVSDFARYDTLNLEFHDFMVRATGNTRLIRLYRGLVKEFKMFRSHGVTQGDALLQSNEEHREIVSALKSGDASRSYQASFRHIGQGTARMLAALDKLSQTDLPSSKG
ncbi:FCD domain-containing protein [Burkholderia sp. S171]|uniref:FCD domain-containing protein n=1 Tax=Burkholderia sp. S171 TaxID=1641860 RepID=UPI00131A6AFE|nr:FCD domain-containing protein [Burkholderia sp. S171]